MYTPGYEPDKPGHNFANILKVVNVNSLLEQERNDWEGDIKLSTKQISRK